MSGDKVMAIQVEVQSLSDAGVNREVQYPVWLAKHRPWEEIKWEVENVPRFH